MRIGFEILCRGRRRRLRWTWGGRWSRMELERWRMGGWCLVPQLFSGITSEHHSLTYLSGLWLLMAARDLIWFSLVWFDFIWFDLIHLPVSQFISWDVSWWLGSAQRVATGWWRWVGELVMWQWRWSSRHKHRAGPTDASPEWLGVSKQSGSQPITAPSGSLKIARLLLSQSRQPALGLSSRVLLHAPPVKTWKSQPLNASPSATSFRTLAL